MIAVMRTVATIVRRCLPAALIVVAISPASALAGGVKLTGHVVGTSYTIAGKTAVPVLLTQAGRRHARLLSPAGVFLLPAKKTLPAVGGAIRPSGLQIGDVFTATVRVPRGQRSAISFTLNPVRLRVTHVSGTPTPAALQREISSLGTYDAQVASAENAKITSLTASARYLNSSFDTLSGKFTSLQSLLTTLQTALGNLSPSQISELVTNLTSVSNSLDIVIAELGSVPSGETVQGQLTSFSTELAGMTSSLGGITGLLGPVPSGDTLQGQIGSLTSSVDGLTSSLSGVTSLLGSVPSGDTLQGQIGTLGSGLDTVNSTLGTLSSSFGTLSSSVGTLSSSFGTVSDQVGYLCNSSTDLVTGTFNLVGVLLGGSNVTCP